MITALSLHRGQTRSFGQLERQPNIFTSAHCVHYFEFDIHTCLKGTRSLSICDAHLPGDPEGSSLTGYQFPIGDKRHWLSVQERFVWKRNVNAVNLHKTTALNHPPPPQYNHWGSRFFSRALWTRRAALPAQSLTLPGDFT